MWCPAAKGACLQEISHWPLAAVNGVLGCKLQWFRVKNDCGVLSQPDLSTVRTWLYTFVMGLSTQIGVRCVLTFSFASGLFLEVVVSGNLFSCRHLVMTTELLKDRKGFDYFLWKHRTNSVLAHEVILLSTCTTNSQNPCNLIRWGKCATFCHLLTR